MLTAKHLITFILTIVYSALLTSSPVAYADDIFDDARIITGASLGYSNFSFPEKLDHEISFPSANLMIGTTLNGWQLSLNSSFTLNDAVISEEEDTGIASRDDHDITLGYQVSDQWSIFTGYKLGKTKMDFISREDADEGISNTLNESYKQEGFYAGVSYSWKFKKAGRLNIFLAYAFLDATNNFGANTDSEEDEDEDEELEFDDLTGTIKGNLDGFSYGVSWTMPLATNLLFQTRFKKNDYQQDINFNGTSFDNIDETFTTLHVGLLYVF